MKRHLLSTLGFIFNNNRNGVVRLRCQAVVEKADAKVNGITTAIFFAIACQLYLAIDGQQLRPAQVANHLHPVTPQSRRRQLEKRNGTFHPSHEKQLCPRRRSAA